MNTIINTSNSSLLDYMSLISYSTQNWSPHGPHAQYYPRSSHAQQWMRDLAKHVSPGNAAAQQITSALYQVSAAIATGRQLPNKPQPVRAYELWRTLQRKDPRILDARHVRDFEYSTYAVVEVLSGAVAAKVNELLESVEELVGVTRFDVDEVR